MKSKKYKDCCAYQLDVRIPVITTIILLGFIWLGMIKKRGGVQNLLFTQQASILKSSNSFGRPGLYILHLLRDNKIIIAQATPNKPDTIKKLCYIEITRAKNITIKYAVKEVIRDVIQIEDIIFDKDFNDLDIKIQEAVKLKVCAERIESLGLI